MNDTPASVERLYRELQLARSGIERLKMGAAMFDAARALVRAGLSAAGESSSPAEAKLALLRRVYGSDLDVRTIARIGERLTTRALPAGNEHSTRAPDVPPWST